MKRKHAAWIVGGVVVAIIVVLCSYGEDAYIDTESARMRDVRQILGVVLTEKTMDTVLTQAQDKDVPPVWEKVRSRTLTNSISPHYQYHGIPFAIASFQRVISELKVPQDTVDTDVARLRLSLRDDEPDVCAEKINATTAEYWRVYGKQQIR